MKVIRAPFSVRYESLGHNTIHGLGTSGRKHLPVEKLHGESNRKRTGITVVELLVVLGVLSLLMALLLPAVQSTRGRARRLECANHMKQIVLATEGFAATHGEYPEYSSGGKDHQGRMHWNVNPLVEILPYLDQGELFDKFERRQWIGSFDSYSGKQLYSPQNAELVKISLPVYICPADGNRPGSCNYRVNLGSGASWSDLDFGDGCHDPKNGNGAFQHMTALSPKDFTDGLSNTVMFGERVIGDGDGDQYAPWRDYNQIDDSWPHCTSQELMSSCWRISGVAPKHASFAGHTWVFPSKAHTAYDHIMTPNSHVPDCASDGPAIPGASNSAISARSQHPGGVNVALGDGAVRFSSTNVDLGVWRRLASRNGQD